MEPWVFPQSYEALWSGLDDTAKAKILFQCAEKAKLEKIIPLVGPIAKKLHSRSQTILKWPASKIAEYLKEFCDSGDFTKSILMFNSFEVHRDLLTEFDDLLGDDKVDEDGAILSKELEACIIALLRDYPETDVRILAQVRFIFRHDKWRNFPEIDFARIQTMLENQDDDEDDDEFEDQVLEDGDSENIDLPQSEATVESLAQRLEELKLNFAKASADLAVAAEALAGGILPDPGNTHTTIALRKPLSLLTSAISKYMRKTGLEGFVDPPLSLEVLEGAIAEIKRTEMRREDARKQIDGALQTLTSVMTLASADGREFTALDSCRRDAANLHAKILKHDQPELSPELLNELKPHEMIVKMLSMDAVAQDEDMQAAELLGTTFGASLVFALGRGLLKLSILPAPTTPPPILHKEVKSEDPSDPLPGQNDDASQKPQRRPVADLTAVAAAPETKAPPAESKSAKPSAPVVEPKAAENGVAKVQPIQTPIVNGPAARDPKPEPETEDVTPEPAEDEICVFPGFERRECETTEACAAELMAAEGAPGSDSLQRIAWLALGEQKSGIAYHLAKCIAGDNQADSLDLFPARIRAVVLGQAIRTPVGPISEQLKIDYSAIATAQDPESEDLTLAYRLLMISSALRPAVLAPDTSARALIELGAQSLPRLDKLYWLCNQITDYANLQMPLDAAALEFIDNSVNLSKRFESFQKEVTNWWERAPKLNFKYAPAQKVWKFWLESGNTLGRLISPIIRNDRDHLAEMKEQIDRLSTETKIRAEINNEDGHKRGHLFEGKINYNALTVFTRHVREAVEFANRWVALQDRQNSDSLDYDYRRKKLLELRIKLDSAQAELHFELSKAITEATDMRVAVALRICLASIDDLNALMHSTAQTSASEPSIKYLLSSDLLMVPGLPLTDEWDPRLSSEQLARLILNLLANPASQNWESVITLLSEDRRDHEAVDRVLEFLAWEAKHTELFNRLFSLQEEHLKQCQGSLTRQIDNCLHQVEVGVSKGLVRDHERAEYFEKIHQITRNLTSIRNFEAEEANLQNILAAIDSSRMLQVEQVQARFESEHVAKDSSAFRRIQAAIERGDVDTANEYIDLTLRGDTLPDPESIHDSFLTFFPKAAEDIDGFLSIPQNSSALSGGIDKMKGIPGIDFGKVPGAQIQEASAMLDAWSAMKKSKRAKQDHIKVFFERMGFNVMNLSEATTSQRALLAMDVEPLKHRDQCLIPYFGSMTNGHYRVICIWDRPSDDEIMNVVRQGRQGAPAIVLYFGRLSEQKRRNIAQLSRADNLNFILIDELMVAYLCGERGSRLPVMFDCTLPFTFVNPYTTTSSNVPAEMFYGRSWERTQIIDPMGSCFVYGGRQLGKTALLLSIKEEFHNPQEQRVALWIDLRSYGDDIWIVLSRAFKDLADVDLQIGDARSEQKLIERLQAWLLANNKRRILLLLDEADNFLKSDSEDAFRRTSSLKGLMERTNRRFKVVFAGLHNVQRTTKQQNHPLAHFGEPICVGPLLDRGEWKEAKALIEGPFWTMGYRFESPDLVTRILSRTNYYPSLIQLYCNQIYQSVKLDIGCLRNGPPFVITTKHVEDAYFSRQYENAIREKFELTLNLDPRYRVLALIIALNSLQGSSNAMTVDEIREQSFTWWKAGFSDSRTDEDFRVLLDEMLGLGILREVNGEFALRTPNLLSLLGRQDQIEQKLLQVSYMAPPPPYAAHVHRTSDRKQNWRRNPLSDQQDSELRAERNSVTVIFGTKAAGIDDVEHFISQSFEAPHFSNCNISVTDVGVFRRYLDDVRSKSQSGTTLVMVRNSPWTLAWIQEALEVQKGRTHFISVVFVADPETTWGLINDRAQIKSLAVGRRINIHSLQPWHSSVLWQWLGDCGIGSNADDELKAIDASTGRWPMILDDFRNAIVSGGLTWKTALTEIDSRLEAQQHRSSYLKGFGLNVPCPHTVLSEMAGLGGQILLDDLAEIMGTIPKPLLADVFQWADLLGLIQPAPGGEWALDPIVSKVLVSETKK